MVDVCDVNHFSYIFSSALPGGQGRDNSYLLIYFSKKVCFTNLEVSTPTAANCLLRAYTLF
ncbi:hypothetical protein CLV59_105139 [Chitinophaga dinghuensis]|uniref:Uncharacterized protein n=1 Tax=Chitinophaga dinghuensis TaxID=1539050 RepID=A0A327VX32_9BACT|nr:hypothetical protein CLV59_105139 [Chitinophaga dinghuensis]